MRIDVPKLWATSYRLLTGVIAGIAPLVQALGVEVKELLLLAEVDGSPYPAELAVKLLMPKPTVTVTVKRLEAAGFVKRAIDTADLRRHRLELTPSGRKVLVKGMGALTEQFGARLAKLTGAEQVELKRLLEKMTTES